MVLHQCDLTLMEPTFFASREVHKVYLTEPFVGNYALAYALGYAPSRYTSDGAIHYREDLSALRERGIYLTPARALEAPPFTLTQFNAQVEGYWSRMMNNAVTDDLAIKLGYKRKASPTNYPQLGLLKMLGIGARFRFYLLASESKTPPRYVRLGKFMSKARIDVSATAIEPPVAEGEFRAETLLNPLDVPDDVEMIAYDVRSVHPVPLLERAHLRGRFLTAPDGIHLPADMTYRVEAIDG